MSCADYASRCHVGKPTFAMTIVVRVAQGDGSILGDEVERRGWVGSSGALRYAAAMFSAVIGSLRRRLPVAANTALLTAGPISAVAGSPMPPGFSVLGTSVMSICGAPHMRTI